MGLEVMRYHPKLYALNEVKWYRGTPRLILAFGQLVIGVMCLESMEKGRGVGLVVFTLGQCLSVLYSMKEMTPGWLAGVWLGYFLYVLGVGMFLGYAKSVG